METSYQKGQK